MGKVIYFLCILLGGFRLKCTRYIMSQFKESIDYYYEKVLSLKYQHILWITLSNMYCVVSITYLRPFFVVPILSVHMYLYFRFTSHVLVQYEC
jgi:hypothetical protein